MAISSVQPFQIQIAAKWPPPNALFSSPMASFSSHYVPSQINSGRFRLLGLVDSSASRISVMVRDKAKGTEDHPIAGDLVDSAVDEQVKQFTIASTPILLCFTVFKLWLQFHNAPSTKKITSIKSLNYLSRFILPP